MSAATVEMLKAMATIHTSPLDQSIITRVTYETCGDVNMAVFDKRGRLMPGIDETDQSKTTIEHGYRRAVMIYSEQVISIVGLVIVDDMMCGVSSINNATRLYHAGKEVYRTKTQALKKYISGRLSKSRAAVLASKRVFFINSLHQVISLLMDKAAIDRGDQIEIEHHSLQGMICIWADDRQLACLTDRGDLDLVDYRAKLHTVKSVNDLKQAFFRADKQFEAANHEAVSITGIAQYLAVAKSCISECTNTVALLNRNGKLLSTSNDNGYSKPLPRKTPIHNMQFIVLKHRIYLVAQNLFT